MTNTYIQAMLAAERHTALLAQAASARAAKRARPGPTVTTSRLLRALRSEPHRGRAARTGQPATETVR